MLDQYVDHVPPHMPICMFGMPPFHELLAWNMMTRLGRAKDAREPGSTSPKLQKANREVAALVDEDQDGGGDDGRVVEQERGADVADSPLVTRK